MNTSLRFAVALFTIANFKGCGMMVVRGRYYDVALYFPGHLKLKDLHDVLKRLKDNQIEIDEVTLKLTENGLYCEADTPHVNISEIIKNIGHGDVFIDWDTMKEWGADGDE